MVLREFRLSKGITAQHAYTDVCSRKTLLGFEKGKHFVGTDIFLGLLRKLEIPMKELEEALEGYQVSTGVRVDGKVDEEFFEKLRLYNYDSKVLEMMLVNKKKFPSRSAVEDEVHVLILSDLIHDLEADFPVPKPSKKVNDFFFSIDIWCYYEMGLLALVIHLLPLDFVCPLLKDLIGRKHVYCSSERKRNCFIRLLINATYSAVKNECLQYAEFFLDTVSSLLSVHKPESVILENFSFEYMQGYWQLISGETDEGAAKMFKAIQIMSLVCDKHFVGKFQRYYREAIVQANKRGNPVL